MGMLRVNDVVFPEPTGFAFAVEPIGRFERNANGGLVGDLIGEKTVIDCEWAMLMDGEFRKVLDAVRPHFAGVEYSDPHTGEVIRREMFISPRGGELALESDGKRWWKGVKLRFTER